MWSLKTEIKIISVSFSGNRLQLGMHSNWVESRRMWIVLLINWKVKVKRLQTWHQHKLPVDRLQLHGLKQTFPRKSKCLHFVLWETHWFIVVILVFICELRIRWICALEEKVVCNYSNCMVCSRSKSLTRNTGRLRFNWKTMRTKPFNYKRIQTLIKNYSNQPVKLAWRIQQNHSPSIRTLVYWNGAIKPKTKLPFR